MMKIAVEGCCHGELDNIYAEIAKLERAGGYKVGMLLICGDFQAIRNPADLQFMAVPDKFKKLGGFYRYYSGEKVAPMLTIIIGGNHEASNYMWELYHGGWLAPNMYYLGAAGSVMVNGLRLAGASGIFKPDHYSRGHYERFPYSSSHIRSIYHTRMYDIQRLMLLDSPDIFLSHDWPLGIEQYGNVTALLKNKPFFRSEVQANTLGSPPLLDLMKTIRPAKWFSAHLHTRFEATYKHSNSAGAGLSAEYPDEAAQDDAANGSSTNPDEIVIDEEVDEDDSKIDESVDVVKGGTCARIAATNPDEITMDDDDDDEAMVPAPGQASDLPPHRTSGGSTSISTSQRPSTYFLALDKCLPHRRYLEIVDVPTPVPVGASGPTVTFDPQWLAITRAFFPYLTLADRQKNIPDLVTMKAQVERQREWIDTHVPHGGAVPIAEIQEFCRTAPGGRERPRGVRWYTNPQTEAFCKMLELENVINAPPRPTNSISPPLAANTPQQTQQRDDAEVENRQVD